MPIREGYRPFQAQGVRIPLENVGVRLSGRRPGERRLNLVRPVTPEQPRTLLQEMKQYITTRQSLRDHGYFFLMGKEPEKINLADATHNDLFAIGLDDSLRDWRSVMPKGNHVRMQKIFDAYSMEQFSPEKQKEVLIGWERLYALNNRDPAPIHFTRLTPIETETVAWLLARVGIPFNTPPEGFSESYASLIFRMRTATAECKQQWEQKTIEDSYRASRRG